MPRQRRRSADIAPSVGGSAEPTRVLDWKSDAVAALERRIAGRPDQLALNWLRNAHVEVRSLIRPVYALNDTQRTSKTLRRGRGSCSQRLAVLEALARRHGIQTRVEGISVDGRFWYPRFPRASWLVPQRVVLAWPEFHIDGQWVAVGELFESDSAQASAFTNAGEDTLFDAIGRTGIAWRGDCSEGVCDLSGHVLESFGYFDDRDSLFERHGQTLCWTARTLGEPFMSHRSAGARTR
jgi:hypothetical protein